MAATYKVQHNFFSSHAWWFLLIVIKELEVYNSGLYRGSDLCNPKLGLGPLKCWLLRNVFIRLGNNHGDCGYLQFSFTVAGGCSPCGCSDPSGYLLAIQVHVQITA